MAGAPNRRRQFFIKKEFQGKFILLYAVSIAAVAGLVGLGLYVIIRRSVEAHLYSSHLKIERTGDLLFDILMRTNVMAVFAIVLLVILLSIIVFGRLNLHFYRMEQRLDAMASGDYTLAPQPGSRFNEISTLIEMVEETRRVCGERLNLLGEALDLLEKGIAGGDREQIRSGRERLDALLSQVQLPATGGRK